MAKYRKRPVVIDAMRLPPKDEDASQELIDFLHAMDQDWESDKDGYIIIKTMEGNMSAKPGDWIIKGINGEYYPCDNDVFEKTYDLAWEETMTEERWKELEKNQELTLTEQEIKDGWHFCYEWDGLLVNSNDSEGEGAACTCVYHES